MYLCIAFFLSKSCRIGHGPNVDGVGNTNRRRRFDKFAALPISSILVMEHIHSIVWALEAVSLHCMALSWFDADMTLPDGRVL